MDLKFNALHVSQSRLFLPGVIRLFLKYVINIATTVLRQFILEAIEEKLLRGLEHAKRMPGNRLTRRMLEWEPEGTRRKVRPKERRMDGLAWSMANDGLGEDIREKDMCTNLVLGAEKQPCAGQSWSE